MASFRELRLMPPFWWRSIGYSKENLKICTGSPSLPFVPFPPSYLPTPLPFLPTPLPVPFTYSLTFNNAQIDFNDTQLV